MCNASGGASWQPCRPRMGGRRDLTKMHENLVENCRKYGVIYPSKCIKMSVLLRKIVDQPSDFVGFPIVLNTHTHIYIQTVYKHTHIHEVKSCQTYPKQCFCQGIFGWTKVICLDELDHFCLHAMAPPAFQSWPTSPRQCASDEFQHISGRICWILMVSLALTLW